VSTEPGGLKRNLGGENKGRTKTKTKQNKKQKTTCNRITRKTRKYQSRDQHYIALGAITDR
jgi:hypothetical protein